MDAWMDAWMDGWMMDGWMVVIVARACEVSSLGVTDDLLDIFAVFNLNYLH